MNIKQEKGITLTVLVTTIIVLLIIAGIGINYGRDTIQKAHLEELETNMLLIKAKAKGLVEEANTKIGLPTASDYAEKQTSVRQELYLGTASMSKVDTAPSGIPQGDNLYEVTKETLSYWGLGDIKLEENEKYIVQLDDENAEVEEVYNTIGYNGKYSLTDIENIEI